MIKEEKVIGLFFNPKWVSVILWTLAALTNSIPSIFSRGIDIFILRFIITMVFIMFFDWLIRTLLSGDLRRGTKPKDTPKG